MYRPAGFSAAYADVTAPLAPSITATAAASTSATAGIATQATVRSRAYFQAIKEEDPFIEVLTVLTMTIGNVVALTQVNVKRMLAYSSIAHTGYIMAGLAAFAATDDPEIAAQGIESVLFYVLGYAVMNIAAFAVVGMLQRDTRRFGGLNSFAGLASRSPTRAAAMGVLMLSLTGIPPTVGFFAKLYVLLAAVDAGLGWLAVILVLNAAMAAFYYLRVIVFMFMKEPQAGAPIAVKGGSAALRTVEK